MADQSYINELILLGYGMGMKKMKMILSISINIKILTNCFICKFSFCTSGQLYFLNKNKKVYINSHFDAIIENVGEAFFPPLNSDNRVKFFHRSTFNIFCII